MTFKKYLVAGLLILSLAFSWFDVLLHPTPVANAQACGTSGGVATAVDYFEQATLPLGTDSVGGAAVGWATFADGPQPTLTLITVPTGDPLLARPLQVTTNTILKVDYTSIGNNFRGFTHAFENPAADLWVSRDWSSPSYTGISFWLKGANSGTDIQFEIFDTRATLPGDTAERWKATVLDNSTGWKKIEIPFTAFNDLGYHPAGSDTFFQRTAVWGWALNFLGSPGARTIYIDEVALYPVPPIVVGPPCPAVGGVAMPFTLTPTQHAQMWLQEWGLFAVSGLMLLGSAVLLTMRKYFVNPNQTQSE